MLYFYIRFKKEKNNEENTPDSTECRLLEKTGKTFCNSNDANGSI